MSRHFYPKFFGFVFLAFHKDYKEFRRSDEGEGPLKNRARHIMNFKGLLRAHQLLPPPLPTTEGKTPRGSQGPWLQIEAFWGFGIKKK